LKKTFSKEYWNNKYSRGNSGWDAGSITTPLKDYFDQISDKNIKILIPGAGNAWEAEYLYLNGFTNVFLLDFAEESIRNFQKRCPDFPNENILNQDFFDHKEKYDLIVEQTFFSSFHPSLREKLISQISNLLKEKGKYMGLIFNHEFNFQGPPFGGFVDEYRTLFQPYFNFHVFETAFNSIKPRKERELFFIVIKKQ
jgi:SAM-dependent methyltransferase